MGDPFRVHFVAPAGVEPPSFDALGGDVSRWFHEGARGLDVGVVATVARTTYPTTGCTAGDLSTILRRAFPDPPTGRLYDLVVLLCHSWVKKLDPPLYGLMFDFKGDDSLLGHFEPSGAPREACAIFLDSFARDGNDIKKARTVIHELGHVFNLVHDRTGSSFMTQGSWGVGWSEGDRAKLALAADGDERFAPGCSNFDISAQNDARASGRPAERSRGGAFRLAATLGKKRYLLGEPVVLELTLSPINARARVVPNELDPGFRALRIWYETPIGERRLFRPHCTFCGKARSSERITRDEPLRSNPRISFGAEGLTFDRPGRYRVWAEFRPRRGHVARSKHHDFEVTSPQSSADEVVSRTLVDPQIAFYVAQKGGALDERASERLTRVLRDHGDHHALKHARYARASALFRRGARADLNDADRLVTGLSVPEPLTRLGVAELKRKIAGARRGS